MTRGIKDDGDIVLSTNNEFFIKGSHKDHNIITYEKGIAVPAKMTTANITKTVMKGFGTGVGGFSNTATILYAMAATFNKPGHEEQYKEIMTRIKLLREIVGQEIDRIKGADKPSLPAEWKKFEQLSPDDTPEEKTRKIKANAMVVSKKPYFFRYRYKDDNSGENLNQKFKRFEAEYNHISLDMFGTKFKKLFKKENKTEDEKNLIRRYQKYSPLITSDCTMNRLCREFENVDFDIKFSRDSQSNSKKPIVSKLPTFKGYYEQTYDQQKLNCVKKLYNAYSNKTAIKKWNNMYGMGLISSGWDDDTPEIRSTIYDAVIVGLQNQLQEAHIDGAEFLYYCYKLSQLYKHFNWGFAWEILDDQILDLITPGESYAPVKDNINGTYEYLGNNYVLQEVTNQLELQCNNIINLIFGDAEFTADEIINKEDN